MTEIIGALFFAAVLAAVMDWRNAFVLCVLVGVVQDPLRKYAAGQPQYFVLLVGVIFGIGLVGASMRNVRLGPAAIHGWRTHLRTPFSVFLVLVFAQAAHTVIRYGSMKMAGIGLLAWLAPVPAVLLAYQFALRRGFLGLRRWMVVYAVTILAALGGVYLEYAGFDWKALGEIGEGQLIYDVGTVLKAHSGFFRASEIAAWHTATTACFFFLLFLGKRFSIPRALFAIALVAFLVSMGILTGRRKMLMEITMFVCAYWFLVSWFQRGMARVAWVVLLAGAVGYVVIVGFVAPDVVHSSYTKDMQLGDSQLEGYAMRGQSVFADLPQRVNDLGVKPVVFAVDYFGWLGAGLGTGTQGTADIAQANGIPRWMGEGGLGKLVMELGTPGLLVIAWLGIALWKHLRAQLTILARVSPAHARLAFGLIALLAANVATFSVATQAYSDLFILLLLGWCTGFLLALPALVARGDPVVARRRGPLRAPAHRRSPPYWPTEPAPMPPVFAHPAQGAGTAPGSPQP